MRQPVKLRGHHLLCILTFIGKGYTAEFVDNMNAIADEISRGAEIEIIDCIDDICAALRQGAVLTCAHARVCAAQHVKHRDRVALKDISRILQIPLLKAGDRLVLGKGEIREMRRHFLHGSTRRACKGCGWHELCSHIAAGGYPGVRLLPKAVL